MILVKERVDREPIDLNGGIREAICHLATLRERGLVGLSIGPLFSAEGGMERDSALFLSCNGRRLRGSDVFQILRGYADPAGSVSLLIGCGIVRLRLFG
jgi:hypothetical protein